MREVVTKRYFGLALAIRKIRFAGPGVGRIAGRAHVRIIEPNGSTRSVPVRLGTERGSVLRVAFPTTPTAVGVELLVPGGARVNSAIVYPTRGAVEPLNTALQVGLSVQPWHLVTVFRHLSYFRSKIRPPVWLTTSAHGATARVVASTQEGGLTVAVRSPRATTLVRSEAWLPGWVARIRVAGTSGWTTRPVVADGLVQAVAVPPGSLTVQFAYVAPLLTEGLVVTVIGIAVLLAACALLVVLRRRAARVQAVGDDR
jgi:hypothetical protein